MKIITLKVGKSIGEFEVPEVDIIREDSGLSLVDLVSRLRKSSKSQARRLIEGGAVSVDGTKVLNTNTRIFFSWVNTPTIIIMENS